jgi:hypothetical protein
MKMGEIKKPDRRSARLGKGVTILGKGEPNEGVTTESKDEGGSIETSVQLGGPGTDPRDETGRRIFRDADE